MNVGMNEWTICMHTEHLRKTEKQKMCRATKSGGLGWVGWNGKKEILDSTAGQLIKAKLSAAV